MGYRPIPPSLSIAGERAILLLGRVALRPSWVVARTPQMFPMAVPADYRLGPPGAKLSGTTTGQQVNLTGESALEGFAALKI